MHACFGGASVLKDVINNICVMSMSQNKCNNEVEIMYMLGPLEYISCDIIVYLIMYIHLYYCCWHICIYINY